MTEWQRPSCCPMKAGGGEMERERQEEAWVRLCGLGAGSGFHSERKQGRRRWDTSFLFLSEISENGKSMQLKHTEGWRLWRAGTWSAPITVSPAQPSPAATRPRKAGDTWMDGHMHQWFRDMTSWGTETHHLLFFEILEYTHTNPKNNITVLFIYQSLRIYST